MAEFLLHLTREVDGAVLVSAEAGGVLGTHHASAADMSELQQAVARYTGVAGEGRLLCAEDSLLELGRQIEATLLAPFHDRLHEECGPGRSRLLLQSESAEVLNLPWELLSRPAGGFLVEGGLAIRRGKPPLLSTRLASLAPPLRLLFAACAPTDLVGLDFEKEEEAILRIAAGLGVPLHLEIVEAGTFSELQKAVAELHPHIVHLSGHGRVVGGRGCFAFEDEKGESDIREAQVIAEKIFRSQGVRAVFLSACETAQAATTGVCETLLAGGHLSLALGWGASIADDLATGFAGAFYQALVRGDGMDEAMSSARARLLGACRVRVAELEWLDYSFTLPRLYVADQTDTMLNPELPEERPARPSLRYALLGDGIGGVREGFVGRRRLLQRSLAALRAGRGKVLLLTGLGGAGKSTLATRLANFLEQDGYRVVPLKARRQDAKQFGRRVIEEVAAACVSLSRPEFQTLLAADKCEWGDRVQIAARMLQESRVLLVLDDLESLMPLPPAPPAWEDSEWADLMAVVVKMSGAGRAILTCRYLPEDFPPAGAEVLHEPMPDFTLGEYLKYLRRHEALAIRMDAGDLAPDLLHALYQRHGGIPRFLEQAAALIAVTESERLRTSLEEPALSGTDQLRDTYFLETLIPQLFEALSSQGKKSLCRLSLVEVPLPLEGVEKVSGLSAAELGSATQSWLALGLVQRFEEGAATLLAVYPLLRGFLLGEHRLTAGETAEGHAAAATYLRTTLEKTGVASLRLTREAALSVCLLHATEGNLPETRRWAVGWLADGYLRKMDFRAVLAVAESSEETEPDPKLITQVGSAWVGLGDWQKGRASYERALALPLDDKLRATVEHLLATVDVNEGDRARGRERMLASLATARRLGERQLEADVLFALAWLDLNVGAYPDARRGFVALREVQQALGDQRGEAASLQQLANLDYFQGYFPKARGKFQEALALTQALGDRVQESALLVNFSQVDMKEGDLAAARTKLMQALALKEELSDLVGKAAVLHNLGNLDLQTGALAEAQSKYFEALSIEKRTGDLRGEAATRIQLGGAFLLQGLEKPAMAEFVRALRIHHEMQDHHGTALALVGLGSWAQHTGNWAWAVVWLGTAAVLLESVGSAEAPAAKMAADISAKAAGLDKKMFAHLTKQIRESCRKNRGAEVVDEALTQCTPLIESPSPYES